MNLLPVRTLCGSFICLVFKTEMLSIFFVDFFFFLLFLLYCCPCLGVDASVKVVYKPVKRSRVESGILSKNVTYSYKQTTEIVNTRSETATIIFHDQLPKSKDEKLKVTSPFSLYSVNYVVMLYSYV